MVLENKGKITGPKEIRPVWDNTSRVNHHNKLTHLHPKRNFVSTTVLTKSGQVPVNTAKQSSHRAAALVSTARHVNTAASRPHVNNALPTTYSYYKAHSPVRRHFNQKSTTKTNNFNEKVNTAKVNNLTTAGSKAVVSAAEENRNNVVKSSRTGKLDFEDVYFVKELMFNLFSVAQMGAKKNNVLFTDILNVLFFLLTLSFLMKATIDESNLWHIRLGHMNFTTMNKLMRGNLARGLPLKIFENDHTCVACQKGKEHKASRERAQMNEFKSMFGQEKDANDNMMFTFVSVAGSTYVYLGGSIPVNAATPPNVDHPIDPLMPDLEDTADL
nr:hypothetical protein [Tanacetum cinerariifolium]